jgi:bifunctional ADP-heptose synthase (sugar kinase/adenylyltransferase)
MTPFRALQRYPDVIVMGGDYERQDVVGSDLCEVEIFQTVAGYSSSSIIGRISELNMHAIKE